MYEFSTPRITKFKERHLAKRCRVCSAQVGARCRGSFGAILKAASHQVRSSDTKEKKQR